MTRTPAPQAGWCDLVVFDERCPPCRFLSKLVVVLSLGVIRRAALRSEHANRLRQQLPNWKGELLFFDRDRMHLGPAVFAAIPRRVVQVYGSQLLLRCQNFLRTFIHGRPRT